MPYNLQVKWIEHLGVNDHKTLENLSEWMKPHIKTMRRLQNSQIPSVSKGGLYLHGEKARDSKFPIKIKKCFICPGEHKTPDCHKLKSMTPKARNDIAFSKKLCLACLSFTNHVMRDCKSAKKCGYGGCKSRHHRLLHQDSTKNENSSTPKEVEENVQDVVEIYHQQTNKSNNFYPIIPVILGNGNKLFETYAFLDTGAGVSLIDETIADKLGLKGVTKTLKLTWTRNHTLQALSRNVQVDMHGYNGANLKLDNIWTIKNLQLPEQSLQIEELKENHEYLRNLPVRGYKNIRPMILLGMNHKTITIPDSSIKGGKHDPVAIETMLGWTVCGDTMEGSNVNVNHIMVHQEELRVMLDKFYSIENFGVKAECKPAKPDSEVRAEKILQETIKYDGNRYEVGLLWAKDKSSFAPNYKTAMSRLCSLEAKLNNNIELKAWAIQTFEDY